MGRRVARKKCETGEGERTFFIIIFVATKNNKINIIEMIRLGKKKQRFERCRNMCTQAYTQRDYRGKFSYVQRYLQGKLFGQAAAAD